MKRTLLSLIIFVMFGNNLFSQTVKSLDANSQKYFDLAIDEIEQMLSSKKSLSFKRAVFLIENAYFGGNLSWDKFDAEIKRITPLLQRIIADRNLQQYKTRGNYAVFTFMFDSIPENNYKPYNYDVDAFLMYQRDYDNYHNSFKFESGMVSYLLKTKKGNYHSLPYLYKILADEINAEAHLAIVPMHIYIKHKDEEGNWWNLETTAGSFSRSSFIMESFNVTEKAIQSGLFMKALNDKESVALCIFDLLCYYEAKTRKYFDDFSQKCYNIGLKYYPISLLQTWKFDVLKYHLDLKMWKIGLEPDYKNIAPYPELVKQYNEMMKTHDFIKEMGYSSISREEYNAKANKIIKQYSPVKTP